jgi:hypothetical protein
VRSSSYYVARQTKLGLVRSPTASELDLLPAVAQLLLRNLRPATSLDDGHKQLRKLLPELRRQAEFTVTEALKAQQTENQEKKRSDQTFVMNLVGALDPFSDSDKCGELACRLSTASRLAQFAALYADIAYVGDPFTSAFAFEDRWTHLSSLRVLENVNLLTPVLPLISAGILKFNLAVRSVCVSCRNELRRRMTAAAASVIKANAKDITFKREGDILAVYAEPFDYTGVVYRHALSRQEKAQLRRGTSIRTLGKRAYKDAISRNVHETLLSTATAPTRGATTLVGSRANLLTIRAMGTSIIDEAELASWEASRATDIPWIKGLTVDQTLELRERAAEALPRFRMRMAGGLSDTSADAPDKVNKIVSDMREESVEVATELRALDYPRGERFRNVSGSLALTIFVYGYAADFVSAAAALGGLMSALALVHQDSRKAHQERNRLESRPGFVLLKAKELLDHA